MNARGRMIMVLCAGAWLVSGCGRRILYEWRDEPYLRPCYQAGEAEARKRMQSCSADERDIGCRVLSIIGREALRAGDTAKARKIADDLMDFYREESNLTITTTIIATGLRNVGPGNERVYEFLKERVRGLQSPIAASCTLASLKAPGAYETIAAAFEQTYEFHSCELRYGYLDALWLLGDRRAIPLFERVIEEIPDDWPEKLHHVSKPYYLRSIRSRLETLKIACGVQQ